MKKLLVFFFIIEQTSNPSKKVDKRYLPFINKIWPGDRSNLPSNRIRILNWNYDFQVEMALADLAKYSNNFDPTDLQRQCLPSSLYMHEDSIPDYYESFAIDQFSICHLNGICYCYKFDLNMAHYIQDIQETFADLPLPSLFDPFDKNQKSLNELEKQLSNYHDLLNKIENFPAIEFAWEKPEINRTPHNIRNKVIDKAIEVTKETDILVVIGYSFPKENLEFDEKIIGAMKSLRGIHIQDKNSEAIMNKFLKIFPKLKNLLYPIPNVDDFFVPAI